MGTRSRTLVFLGVLLAFGGAAGASPGGVRDLRVTGLDPATGEISLAFEPACEAADHHIEYGPLAAVGGLGYSGQLCGLGTSGTVAGFDPGSGSFFFLVVANDGIAIEGSYGTALVGGAMVERSPDLLDPSCPYEQDLSQRCDGPVVPVMEIRAWRSQTEAYGAPFRRTEVPADQKLVPGVGVRVNGDDDDGNGQPDADDPVVPSENDLVELSLSVMPAVPPEGVEYLLRRSDGDVELWTDPTKQTPVFGAVDEVPLGAPSGSRTVWAEMPVSGEAEIEVLARVVVGGSVLAGDLVRVFSYTGLVIALGGEGQVPADPPLEPSNHGTFQLALELYGLGYDVRMYDEDVVSASGSGAAYDEVVAAVQDREVSHVAIFGYSHGAGSTNDLARRLDDNRAAIGFFSIDFTGYVDAIDNDSDIDIGTETELPPSTLYHVNYYENPGCGFFQLCGGPIAGADLNLNVNTTPWGAGLGHFEIDDAPEVLSGIRDELTARTPR